ncbi:MAG TPA: hypothetical protein VFL93_12380 [Longimicrobiaceae bacterium]|nr:hypothetical protein [Longimicrobiaceae bacterium]
MRRYAQTDYPDWPRGNWNRSYARPSGAWDYARPGSFRRMWANPGAGSRYGGEYDRVVRPPARYPWVGGRRIFGPSQEFVGERGRWERAAQGRWTGDTRSGR